MTISCPGLHFPYAADLLCHRRIVRAFRITLCLCVLSVATHARAEVAVSRTAGYLNPCGCSKPQKGGIARRATALRLLRDSGRELVCTSSGKLVTGIGRQDEIKFQILMEALRHMGYCAVNVTPNELYLGMDVLRAFAGEAGYPALVCANLKQADRGSVFPAYTIAKRQPPDR